MGLVKLVEYDYLLLFDMYYIILDGVFVGVLIDELFCLYGGEMFELLWIYYKDYVVWQQIFIELEQYCKQEEYWFWEFDGEFLVLMFLVDYSCFVV